MSNKKFCVVPWKELYATSIGTYRLCCLEEDSERTKDHQTKIDQGIDVHWNSNYMKQSRLDFLSGTANPSCAQCWTDDANGRVSLRQRKNLNYIGVTDAELDPHINYYQSITALDGGVETDINGVNLSVGNTCQLRCVHCSPAYSTGVAKEYVRLGWDSEYKTRRIILTDEYMGAHNQRKFDIVAWPNLKSIAQHLTTINCTGGEPVINRGLLEFMQWLEAQGLAKNISFSMNTNAATLKDSFVDAVKKFKNVDIRISIDGTAAIDHYVRFPTNWSQKVEIIDRFRVAFPSTILFTTVHALNIVDLPDLVDVAKSWNMPHDLANLHYPYALDIKHLPEELKKKIIKKLLAKIDRENKLNPVNAGLRSVIQRLAMPGNPESWAEAKNIIRSYDRVRPYTLASVSPDLAPYLE